MLDWDDFRLFSSARHDTLAAAAMHPYVTQPTISRGLSWLQAAMDVCLLQRPAEPYVGERHPAESVS